MWSFPLTLPYFFYFLFPSKISNILDFSNYVSLSRTDSPRDCNSSNMLWIEFPQYSCLPGSLFPYSHQAAAGEPGVEICFSDPRQDPKTAQGTQALVL